MFIAHLMLVLKVDTASSSFYFKNLNNRLLPEQQRDHSGKDSPQWHGVLDLN